MASCPQPDCDAHISSSSEDYPEGIAAEQKGFRNNVDTAFASVSSVLKASFAPMPMYPNAPSNDTLVKPTGLLADLRQMGFGDMETLTETVKASVTGDPEDDNKLLMEHIIQLAAKLEPTSKAGDKLSDSFINQLWDQLPHPPLSSLGPQYKYRTADGSHNNMHNPQLGKAGQAYARSARPQIYQNAALPDPGLIFDSLLARNGEFEPHPNKISSQMFYLAVVIIRK